MRCNKYFNAIKNERVEILSMEVNLKKKHLKIVVTV